MAPISLESIPALPTARLTAEERRGESVYDAFCWTCHGVYGHGDGPGARGFDAPLPELGRAVSTRPVGEVVARMQRPYAPTGSPTGEAVWHALKLEDLRAAVAYAKTFAPPGSRGNPAAGRLIYATYCVHCHGVRGAGDGRLARTLARPPTDLRALRIEGHADQLLAALKAGGSRQHGEYMPKWGRVFSDQQLQDVVAYLSVLRTRP